MPAGRSPTGQPQPMGMAPSVHSQAGNINPYARPTQPVAEEEGWMQRLGNWMTGNPSNAEYNSLPSVDQLDPRFYQLTGLQNYLSSLGNVNIPVGDFTQATASRIPQEQLLQQFMAQSQGAGPATPAQIMLQQAQQRALAGNQSLALSQRGMNPALGMRNVMNANAVAQGNIAGQNALLRAQETQQANQLAANQANALRQQDMAQAQTEFATKMQNQMAMADIARMIFGAQTTQDNLALERERDRQTYQIWQRQQQEQRMMNNNRSRTAVARGLATALGTAGGAVAGGFASGGNPMGVVVGGQMGGQFGNNLFGGNTQLGTTDYSMFARNNSNPSAAMFDTPAGPMSAEQINAAGNYGQYRHSEAYPRQAVDFGYA